ncbi:MAG: SDR family NAD(P)-dependent oxidoreductase, partial [Salinibacterium sp.]|nr:SDR family NAD(P)-dependent oxidoreductase [Salinibacterium sp.]
MDSVAGRIVVITGGAMGMGKLYAQRAVAEGAAHVVLLDVNEDALAATAFELEAAGGTVASYVVDLASRTA